MLVFTIGNLTNAHNFYVFILFCSLLRYYFIYRLYMEREMNKRGANFTEESFLLPHYKTYEQKVRQLYEESFLFILLKLNKERFIVKFTEESFLLPHYKTYEQKVRQLYEKYFLITLNKERFIVKFTLASFLLQKYNVNRYGAIVRFD